MDLKRVQSAKRGESTDDVIFHPTCQDSRRRVSVEIILK